MTDREEAAAIAYAMMRETEAEHRRLGWPGIEVVIRYVERAIHKERAACAKLAREFPIPAFGDEYDEAARLGIAAAIEARGKS